MSLIRLMHWKVQFQRLFFYPQFLMMIGNQKRNWTLNNYVQTYFIWLINISFSKSSCDLLTSFPLYHVMENYYESYLLARNLLLHTSAWIIACSTSSLSSCKTLWRCLISRSDWDLSRIKRSYLRSATKTYQQLIWNWQLNQNKLK